MLRKVFFVRKGYKEKSLLGVGEVFRVRKRRTLDWGLVLQNDTKRSMCAITMNDEVRSCDENQDGLFAKGGVSVWILFCFEIVVTRGI